MTSAVSTPANPRSASAQTLVLLRKLHLYLGVFIAPMLLFFAFTGAVQTLSLHEAASNYTAPNLLRSLGQIHKNQTYLLPPSRPAAPPAPTHASPGPWDQPASHARQPPTLAAKQRQHLPLKIFFLAVSLSLCLSTLTGIYMAYKYNRNRLLITGLLLAGIVVPITLVNF